MTIRPGTLKRQAAGRLAPQIEFAAGAAVLLAIMVVGSLAVGIGLRWGLVWGLVTGFLGWGGTCSLALVCSCIASARHLD